MASDPSQQEPSQTQEEIASPVRRLADTAGGGFVSVSFFLPVVAAFAALSVQNVVFLNLVHVVSGAIWAGATVFVAGLYGPTLNSLEPDIRGQVNTPMIPKAVLLFAGVTFATLSTGPVMAVYVGLWDLTDPRIVAAVALGAALLIGATYLIWAQVAIFDEVTSPGPPDGDRLQRLGARIGTVGTVMLLLQIAILADMSLLATT